MELIRICPNENCLRKIHYNRKDSYNNAINKKTICAKCTRAKRGAIYTKSFDGEIIDRVLNIYYDKTKVLTTIADECGIAFETLNKIIKTNNLPQLERESKVINRENSYKKMFKTKYGIEYDDFLKNKPIFDKYKSKVKYYTNKTIKKFAKYIDGVDKVGRGVNDYHIDHIVSIKECFLNNIDPIIVADEINLRAIPRFENLSKGAKSLYTPEILLNNVTERNNNRIKISELYGIFY